MARWGVDRPHAPRCTPHRPALPAALPPHGQRRCATPAPAPPPPQVFKGIDTSTGDVVAIKQISLNNVSSDNLASVMGEIELLKTLHHKNIVKYVGSFKTRSHLYIILEFMENGALSSVIKPNRFGAFPESLAAVYIAQVGGGVRMRACQACCRLLHVRPISSSSSGGSTSISSTSSRRLIQPEVAGCVHGSAALRRAASCRAVCTCAGGSRRLTASQGRGAVGTHSRVLPPCAGAARPCVPARSGGGAPRHQGSQHPDD